MAKVTNEAREEVLAIYRPEQKVLLEADIDYPKAKGKFRIGPCYYALVDLKHATDIEIQLCLNQLAFVLVYDGIINKVHPYLEGKDFEKLQKEGMLIVESRKGFRRPIPTDNEIYGEMTLKDLRERNGVVFANADFQFENRSCFGNLELAIVERR